MLPQVKMAVNRIRGAFAVPKKGETFELRAGLVYALDILPREHIDLDYQPANILGFLRSQYAYER